MQNQQEQYRQQVGKQTRVTQTQQQPSNTTWQMWVCEGVLLCILGINEQMSSSCAGRWLILGAEKGEGKSQRASSGQVRLCVNCWALQESVCVCVCVKAHQRNRTPLSHIKTSQMAAPSMRGAAVLQSCTLCSHKIKLWHLFLESVMLFSSYVFQTCIQSSASVM